MSYNVSRAYATINGTNLDTTHGMRLTSYSAGTPVPLIKLIDIPGKQGKLDATLALNGKVNYVSRPVTMEFHVRNNTYPEFQTLLSALLAAFNGTESKVVISTDPDYYYKGRFQVDSKKSNPITSTIIISCADAFPYKLEEVTVERNGSGNVTCTGKSYNGPLTVYSSNASTSVTFAGETYQLTSGNNVIREIHLANGSNTLQFTGSGTFRVTYERGIL